MAAGEIGQDAAGLGEVDVGALVLCQDEITRRELSGTLETLDARLTQAQKGGNWDTSPSGS
ncbi:hypothetical protein [Streptomyces sp. NPDC050759]|uniref:hypothetical protein n=1 Tax=Streptomyces sp. NPDC050759 TaxID=3365635 RepID=UPI0037A3313E